MHVLGALGQTFRKVCFFSHGGSGKRDKGAPLILNDNNDELVRD